MPTHGSRERRDGNEPDSGEWPLEELDPQRAEWISLTPGERLIRSWALRARIPDLAAVHDEKLFPKP